MFLAVSESARGVFCFRLSRSRAVFLGQKANRFIKQVVRSALSVGNEVAQRFPLLDREKSLYRFFPYAVRSRHGFGFPEGCFANGGSVCGCHVSHVNLCAAGETVKAAKVYRRTG